MNSIKLLKRSLIVALFMVAPIASASYVVVVNPSNPTSISEKDVAAIFLGKLKAFENGANASPLVQSNPELKNAFIQNVVKKSPSQFKAYWSKKVFTGKGTAPKELDTSDAVKDLVKKNPEYIGYIEKSKADDSVKVLFSF